MVSALVTGQRPLRPGQRSGGSDWAARFQVDLLLFQMTAAVPT